MSVAIAMTLSFITDSSGNQVSACHHRGYGQHGYRASDDRVLTHGTATERPCSPYYRGNLLFQHRLACAEHNSDQGPLAYGPLAAGQSIAKEPIRVSSFQISLQGNLLLTLALPLRKDASFPTGVFEDSKLATRAGITQSERFRSLVVNGFASEQSTLRDAALTWNGDSSKANKNDTQSPESARKRTSLTRSSQLNFHWQARACHQGQARPRATV